MEADASSAATTASSAPRATSRCRTISTVWRSIARWVEDTLARDRDPALSDDLFGAATRRDAGAVDDAFDAFVGRIPATGFLRNVADMLAADFAARAVVWDEGFRSSGARAGMLRPEESTHSEHRTDHEQGGTDEHQRQSDQQP